MDDRQMREDTIKSLLKKKQLTDEALKKILGDKYVWDGERVIEK